MKFVLFLMMIFTSTFASPSIDIDTSESDKFSIDQSVQQKKNLDQKKSNGNRESVTNSTGHDTMSQSQWKADQQANRSNGVDISVGIQGLFVDYIADLEKTGVQPFGYCKLFTRPRLAENFGFTATVTINGRNFIDNNKASFMENAARSNSDVANVDLSSDEKLKVYRDCMAYYGAVIGQSIMTLNDDLPYVAKVSNVKSSRSKIIKDIGIEDLKLLAEGALNKTLKNGVKSQYMKTYYNQIINDDQPCRFNGSTQSISCGNSTLGISSKPNLSVGSVQYFGSFEGADYFAGMTGSYKIGATFSYSNAIDQLESTSKYQKFAKDIQSYTEDLVSKGYAKEAVKAKKKAYDWAASNKTAIRVDKSFIDSFK